MLTVTGHKERLFGQHELIGGWDNGEALGVMLLNQVKDGDAFGIDQAAIEGGRTTEIDLLEPDTFGEMPLRVKIDEQNPLTSIRQRSSEIDSKGGLANASF
jgi:hypothetical protein